MTKPLKYSAPMLSLLYFIDKTAVMKCSLMQMKMGRVPYALSYQGDGTFVARDEPDAIRLTFSLLKDHAVKLVFEMAAMHWYAERVS